MPLLNSPEATVPLGQKAESAPLREQFVPRASAQDLAVYFGQMRSLLNAGVGLFFALDEMARSAPNAHLRGASLQMKEQISQGRPWSEAMRAFPALFPPLMPSLIAAGEASGNMPEVCGELARFAEQEYQMFVFYQRETWYPKVLLFVSTVIIPLPISIVFFGTPLTLGFTEQALFFGGLWAAWEAGSWFWPVLSYSKTRLWMDRWKLKLPFVKEVAQGFAVAKVWRLISLLYAAGVSLPTAVRHAANGCGNAAFAQSLLAAAPRLERGETLHQALASTGEFPESALGFLSAAEQAGDLDKTLPRSMIMIEMEAQTRLLMTAKLITQLLYLVVAFKVALQIIQAYTGTSLHIG